jgi:hypothetical protein
MRILYCGFRIGEFGFLGISEIKNPQSEIEIIYYK